MAHQSKNVSAIVAMILVSVSAVAAEVTRPADRTVAKDFALRDASGATVSLTALKGNVVLLDFWATWCTGCKEEMPWFAEFQDRHKQRGLRSLGVALDEEGWKKVRPYLMEHPINYPIVVGDAAFAATYGVTAALPVTVLIDRSGRIAEIHVGKVSKDAFETDIKRLLDEKSRQ